MWVWFTKEGLRLPTKKDIVMVVTPCNQKIVFFEFVICRGNGGEWGGMQQPPATEGGSKDDSEGGQHLQHLQPAQRHWQL